MTITDAFNTKDPDYKQKIAEKVAAYMGGTQTPAEGSTQTPKEEDPVEMPSVSEQAKKKERGSQLKLEDDIVEEKVEKVPEGVFEWEDELGEKVQAKVNLSDKEEMINLLKAQRMVKDLEDEIKAMKDIHSSEMSIIDKEKERLGKWQTIAKLGSEMDQIDAILQGKGGLDAFRESIINEYKQYESMSEDEKVAFDSKKAQMAQRKKEEDLARKYEEALEALNNKEQEMQVKALENHARLAYQKYKISGEGEAIKDINETGLSKAKKSLKSMKEKGITLTQAIIDREVKKAFSPLKQTFNKSRSYKDLETDMDEATSKAQTTIQSDRVSAGNAETKAQTFTRWMDFVKAGQTYKITKEITVDPKKQDLFLEFGSKLKF